MHGLRVILSIGLAWLAAGEAAAQSNPKPGAVRKYEPMIFFVAKGGPNACGPGCDTWIAAEGDFDPDIHSRFDKFFDSIGRPDIPIFFHSRGGNLMMSVMVGRLLRIRRVTAGVGRTIPERCGNRALRAPACMALLNSGRPVKARLQFGGAVCASACVYTLIGATDRRVSPGTRVGIHAFAARLNPQAKASPDLSDPAKIQAARERTKDLLRGYFVSVGVDPALVDVAEKTSFKSMHWMTLKEMTRFGIIRGDKFETPWVAIGQPHVSVSKSLSRTAPRTTTITISCNTMGRVYLSVYREVPADEAEAKSIVKIKRHEQSIWQSLGKNGQLNDQRADVVSLDILRKAADGGLRLDEEVALPGGVRTRTAHISTAGLTAALDQLPAVCAAPHTAR